MLTASLPGQRIQFPFLYEDREFCLITAGKNFVRLNGKSQVAKAGKEGGPNKPKNLQLEGELKPFSLGELQAHRVILPLHAEGFMKGEWRFIP